MLGADTNVLLRFFIRDDAKHTLAAKRFIVEATKGGRKIVIDRVVLCELVWVLETGYDFRKAEIAALLRRILSTKQFEIGEKEIVWLAVDDYSGGQADFADCIIGRANIAAGADLTVTFDRGCKGLKHFRVL